MKTLYHMRLFTCVCMPPKHRWPAESPSSSPFAQSAGRLYAPCVPLAEYAPRACRKARKAPGNTLRACKPECTERHFRQGHAQSAESATEAGTNCAQCVPQPQRAYTERRSRHCAWHERRSVRYSVVVGMHRAQIVPRLLAGYTLRAFPWRNMRSVRPLAAPSASLPNRRQHSRNKGTDLRTMVGHRGGFRHSGRQRANGAKGSIPVCTG